MLIFHMLCLIFTLFKSFEFIRHYNSDDKFLLEKIAIKLI